MKKKISAVLIAIIMVVTLFQGGEVVKADTTKKFISNGTITADKFKNNPTGLNREDANSEKWVNNNIKKIDNISELKSIIKDEGYSKSRSSLSKDNSIKLEESLPDSADNSTSSAFPKVASQIGGSCVCYSTTYYQMTYAYNKLHGTSGKEASNICSPNFVYNLLNEGKDSGTTISGNYMVLKEIGAATQKTVPIKVNGSDNYYSDYHANANAFKDANSHKIKEVYTVSCGDKSLDTPITGPKDSDLDLIKYGLANGEVYSFGTDINKFTYNTIRKNSEVPENDNYIGQYIVSRCCQNSEGPHEMTIVGYDDNIWVDVNQDSKVEEAEKGAFKVVNSWGSNYCNDGFIWISYDALNKVSAVNNSNISSKNRIPAFDNYEVYGITVKDDKELSNVYLKIELNTKLRDTASVEISDMNESNGKKFLYPLNGVSGGSFGFDGSKESSNGTFILDLSNYDDNITYDYVVNNGIKVIISDYCKDNNPLKIISASIINTDNNDEIKLLSNEESIDGDLIELYSKAPSVNKINNLHLTANEGKVDISYDAPCNNENVKYYEIYRDTIFVGKTSKTFFEDNVNLSGTFNYKVRAMYNDGTYSPFSKDSINLNYTEKDIVKIYYKNKNFDKAYIHYKVGNGTWTNLPGKEMMSSELKKGYYEYTIDLSSYNNNKIVTACFNNGSNVWDNNNGNNYILSAGYYTLEDGKLEKTYADLKAGDLVFDKDSPCVLGDSINIYANVSGGSGKYKYLYYISGDKNGSKNTLIDMGKRNSSYNWKPEYASNYIINCDVEDTITGESVSLYSNFNIVKEHIKITSIDFDKESPQPINSAIAMKINTCYTDNNLSYTVNIYKDGKKVNGMYSPNLDNNFIWDTSYSAGEYDIEIKVKDSLSGCEDSKNIKYVIEDAPLQIQYFKAFNGYTGNEEITTAKAGTDYRLEVHATGGSCDYGQYNYSYTCLYNGKKFDLSNYNSNCLYGYVFEKAGKYTINCHVSDKAGNKVSKKFKVTITQGDLIIYNATLNNYILNYGDKVELDVQTKYALGNVYYKVTDIDPMGIRKVIQDFNTNNKISWIPETPGIHTINLEVKDKRNKVIKNTYYYTVKWDPLIINSFDFVNGKNVDVVKGDKVEVKADVTGGYGDYDYDVYALDELGNKYYLDEEENGIFSFTPEQAGKYTIYLNVTDEINNSEIRALDLTVNNSKNFVTIYYKGYENPNIHYKIDNGTWTSVPGVSMNKSSKIEGYDYEITIDLKEGNKVTACFNDGANNWDNNNGKNYTFTSGCYKYSNGVISKIEDKSDNHIITLYYKGFDVNSTYVHYKIGNGTWTTSPGIIMNEDSDEEGYAKLTINLGNENSLTACFNNGSGTWDNNYKNNYYFDGSGIYYIYNNKITKK